MTFLNKIFKKQKEEPSFAKAMEGKEKKPVAEKKVETEIKKPVAILKSSILISPITTEKAASGQKSNQYVFKILPSANKIMVADAIRKTYKVKVVAINIINIPKKEIVVGRTKGFKAGYKKAIITLPKGQTIEIK